ncbi:MAG: class I SAM-dependent methyltransferase [Isosphaeraceae bacterium]
MLINVDDPRTEAATDDPVRRLKRAYPWPDARPPLGPVGNPGWLGEGTEKALAAAVSPQSRVVVELGAWLGMSTRYIAGLAPHATVISVDHWAGSPEHQTRPEFRDMLPTLYDSFLSLCWDDRDRIIPLRMSTLDGLRKVAEFGVQPDIVYIDAEHSYPAVSSELELARELFPKARLVGDDYDWEGVREAANGFARRHGLSVERMGARGWMVTARSSASRNGHSYSARAKWAVLVPYLGSIDGPCQNALNELEASGVRVVRRQEARRSTSRATR